MNFLDKILAEKAHEIARAKTACSESEMRSLAAKRITPFRGFEAALQHDGVRIVAEIKRASPSKGDIQLNLDAAATAAAYEAGGASALSVLTEPAYFKGSIQDMRDARNAVSIPVLRKDFIIEPYQVYESCAIGADAILLIVRILNDFNLCTLYALAKECGLDVLTEVFDEADLDRALKIGASIIGINNRNLASFSTDLMNAPTLATRVKPPAIGMALSGVSDTRDVAQMAHQGISKFLIGEALVKCADPATLLGQMLSCEVHRG